LYTEHRVQDRNTTSTLIIGSSDQINTCFGGSVITISISGQNR